MQYPTVFCSFRVLLLLNHRSWPVFWSSNDVSLFAQLGCPERLRIKSSDKRWLRLGHRAYSEYALVESKDFERIEEEAAEQYSYATCLQRATTK